MLCAFKNAFFGKCFFPPIPCTAHFLLGKMCYFFYLVAVVSVTLPSSVVSLNDSSSLNLISEVRMGVSVRIT